MSSENTKNHSDIEPEQILKLWETMVEDGLSEVSIQSSNSSIYIKRKITTETNPPTPTKTFEKTKQITKEEAGIPIKAPLTGTFYRSPSPTSPPFVKEGDTVNANQILCIIEAMKVMNEIRAEFPCKILKIFVENGHVVNANENIFLVEKL